MSAREEIEKIKKLKNNNIKIPTFFGRKMVEVKKYPNFILYEDTKTKVKSCFLYEELGREKERISINN